MTDVPPAHQVVEATHDGHLARLRCACGWHGASSTFAVAHEHHALHVAITHLPLKAIAHALEQTTADSWVAVNRNGDVRLVVPKGNGYTLARPQPRKKP